MTTSTEHDPWMPPQARHSDPPGPSPVERLRSLGWLAMLSAAAWVMTDQITKVIPPNRPWLLLVVLPVGLFGFLLIAGSIRVHRSQWIALDPGYEPFDPDGPGTPPEVARHFAAAGEELGRQGFNRALVRRTVGSNPNAIGFVALYRHRETLEQIKLIGVLVRMGLARRVVVTLVCTTEFADGTEVVTSNLTTARMLPKYPLPYHSAVFPELTDAARLVPVHRAHVAEYAAGRIRVDPIGDDPAESLRRKDHQRFLDHCLAVGYTRVDEAAGRHRYTWKGATLAAWKLSPPIKQIRLAIERRAARRHLARLEAR